MTTLDRRQLLTLGAGAALLGRAAHADEATPQAGLDALLTTTGVPALAGAVVTTGGLDALVAGGVRRQGAPGAVTTDDLWHLGSNTKAMTGALYGRLVDRSRARWGLTVPELFPDLTIDPAWKTITIDQIFGHRAGIDDRPIFGGGWLLKAHQDTRPLREQRIELARTVFGAPPQAPPGPMLYSNTGYILAGAAIERITDAAWEDAVTAELFRPLGMASAGFGPPLGAQPWGHRAPRPGSAAPEAPVVLTPMDPTALGSDNPPALGPAGRAHMSMTDYAKFIRLFLTRGGGLLTPATVERLITPVPGEGRGYAIGWGVVTDRPWGRGPVLAHEGSNTLWHAVAIVAPGRGVGIITAANAPPGADKGAPTTLVRQLQERFAPA
jgi:CubicO group peptidase (beta-lactamase class C family)